MEHVLLIEGHRMMRSALKDLLTQSGFDSVDEAIDPIEAVGKAMRICPHIIVLDTTWPEIKGVYLSRILRLVSPQSKIVLLVDNSWKDDQEITRSSDADAWVAKTVLTKELPQILDTWKLSGIHDK